MRIISQRPIAGMGGGSGDNHEHAHVCMTETLNVFESPTSTDTEVEAGCMPIRPGTGQGVSWQTHELAGRRKTDR